MFLGMFFWRTAPQCWIGFVSMFWTRRPRRPRLLCGSTTDLSIPTNRPTREVARRTFRNGSTHHCFFRPTVGSMNHARFLDFFQSFSGTNETMFHETTRRIRQTIVFPTGHPFGAYGCARNLRTIVFLKWRTKNFWNLDRLGTSGFVHAKIVFCPMFGVR